MSSVTLSDGRVVELHEPTIVEEIEIVAKGANDLAELLWHKMAVIAPAVTRESVDGHDQLICEGKAISRTDGHKLIMAVGKVWDGPSEDEERPLGNGSVTSSTVSTDLSSSITP